MTLQDYIRVVRERWIILVVATILGVAGATAIYVIRPAQYTASLTMYVSTQGADTTQAAFQGAQLSQDRVTSYTELLTSTRVTKAIINRLNLQIEPAQLAKQISASSKLNSVLLDISVADTSPARAADIANAVGDYFPQLVGDLERPTTPGATPPVAVRVVQPADIPTGPSSIGLPLMLALGLGLGLVIGISGCVIRNSLDTSLRTIEKLAETSSAPNLGVVLYDSRASSNPLIVRDSPQAPRAEAFRHIRTSLQYVAVDQPPKSIVVTSSLPSEGKTTTVLNLATALASAGSRVIVVDADLRRPRVGEVLGIDRSVGLTNILSGRLSLDQAIQHWAGGAFDVIASGPTPPNPSELLSSNQMRRALEELRARYDHVLIDTPPLLPVTDAAAVAPSSDGVVLLCRYKKASQHDVETASAAIRSVGATLLGTVFTMLPASKKRSSQYRVYYDADRVHRNSLPGNNGQSALRPPSEGGRTGQHASWNAINSVR